MPVNEVSSTAHLPTARWIPTSAAAVTKHAHRTCETRQTGALRRASSQAPWSGLGRRSRVDEEVGGERRYDVDAGPRLVGGVNERGAAAPVEFVPHSLRPSARRRRASPVYIGVAMNIICALYVAPDAGGGFATRSAPADGQKTGPKIAGEGDSSRTGSDQRVLPLRPANSASSAPSRVTPAAAAAFKNASAGRPERQECLLRGGARPGARRGRSGRAPP